MTNLKDSPARLAQRKPLSNILNEPTLIHCDIFGYSSLGIPVSQIITALWETAETFHCEPVRRNQITLHHYESQGTMTFENRFRQTNGSPVQAKLHAHVLRDSSGAVRSIRGFIEDTSERQRTNAANTHHRQQLEHQIIEFTTQIDALQTELITERQRRMRAEEHVCHLQEQLEEWQQGTPLKHSVGEI